MIDSVALTWGQALGSAPRRVDAPAHGRRRELLAEPVNLDVERLRRELGDDDGQVRTINYKAGASVFCHWQVDEIEILYRPGRVELRASLPKIAHGRNDVVLDERSVHHALRTLTERAQELCHVKLDLREAVPTRLDYCFQWEVPSVAWICEHLRLFGPARKVRTENVSALGGRSIAWGYGSKKVVRFYDKRAEIFERERKEIHLGHGIPQEALQAMKPHDRRRAIAAAVKRRQEEAYKAANIDTLLRYEVQDRRRERLRLVHENGYRADDVRRELVDTIAGIASTERRSFEQLLDSYDGWTHGIAYTAASFYFAEHEGDLQVVRNRAGRKTLYAWRRRARQAAAHMIGDWNPVIPPDSFVSPSPIWTAA